VAGEIVVRRWDGSREFFVVLGGTAEVWAGEQLVASLGPGDFFGELAPLSGGELRLRPARVGDRHFRDAAAGPARRDLEPAGARAPSLGDRIRRAVQERLPGL
jgi:aromatic-L-amino-acid/L-tryptophan decarboxylase